MQSMYLKNQTLSFCLRESFANADESFSYVDHPTYHTDPGDGWMFSPLLCYRDPFLGRNNFLSKDLLLRDISCIK